MSMRSTARGDLAGQGLYARKWVANRWGWVGIQMAYMHHGYSDGVCEMESRSVGHSRAKSRSTYECPGRFQGSL
jgi:hypothetical protein